MASISSVHWADGGVIDLKQVAPALNTHDARFVIDATHAAGVMKLDVRTLDPDFLVFPTYKWVLGPYGRAFLYVARRWQNGVPIEQAGSQRRAISSERGPYMRDTAYVPNARRYDMGGTRPLHLAGNGLDRHGNGCRLGQRRHRRAAAHADRPAG
jgi:selenocysteine lyase/cysteine desulfurase